ncbi:hypothetical protein [Peribacillus simplex]|uniref:hypothetical protein n=1 Tax=Peribacillus simplex TaxID=1478 RepID=UPI0028531C96|nr:hypothetical protein [Peribacillus simplex]MDR4927238.1 hypothetical protein [Peribacillus simplex]
MIEKIFTKKSLKKPLILTKCTLFINLEHYDIGTTYIFSNQTTYKVEEFSSEWVQDNLKTEIFNKGYFSSPPYLDFIFGEKFNHPDEVAIIGYSKGIRYYVSGISVGDNSMSDNFVAKFRFLDCKKINNI